MPFQSTSPEPQASLESYTGQSNEEGNNSGCRDIESSTDQNLSDEGSDTDNSSSSDDGSNGNSFENDMDEDTPDSDESSDAVSHF